MRIRQHEPEELHAVLALVGDAFADEPAVVDLVEDLASDAAFVPRFSLVAEDGTELIGYVLLTRATVETPGGAAVPVLTLAPLGVRSDRQHQGVGSALVAEALRRAREHGELAVFVLGDPAYYGRFGFVPATSHDILPPLAIEYPEAWQYLELAPRALAGVIGTVRFETALGDPKYW